MGANNLTHETADFTAQLSKAPAQNQAQKPAKAGKFFKQHKSNKTMKKTTMWMMALLLCWGCGPGEGLEGLDELAFGRYEYAGFDTTKFKFYRLKDDNTYQEVIPKPSEEGMGALNQDGVFCDYNENTLYGCGKFADLPKPFIEIKANAVEMGFVEATSETFLSGETPYVIRNDSIIFGDGKTSDTFRFLMPNPILRPRIKIQYRMANASTKGSFMDLQIHGVYYAKNLDEHIKQTKAMFRSKPGDTLALCIFNEIYEKK